MDDKQKMKKLVDLLWVNADFKEQWGGTGIDLDLLDLGVFQLGKKRLITTLAQTSWIEGESLIMQVLISCQNTACDMMLHSSCIPRGSTSSKQPAGFRTVCKDEKFI